MKIELTTASAKDQAKHLAAYLGSIKRKISHGNALEAVAQMYGRKSWNVLSSQLEGEAKPEVAGAEPASSVPLSCFVQMNGTRVALEVSAEAHSDDRRKEVDFDAAPWFARASDEEIIALAECDWGGDYPADAVAENLSDRRVNEDLVELFAYLNGANEHLSMYEDTIGFECNVEEAYALQYCRAFRYSLFVKLMLIGMFDSLELEGSDAGKFVYESSDHPGEWVFVFEGVGSDITYPTEDEAYAALGEYLESRFADWDDAVDCDLSEVLSVAPGSGEYVGQVPSEAETSSDDEAVPGRDLNYVDNRGAVLVMKLDDKPLSHKALRHITNDAEYGLRIAVPVELGELISGGMESLNDSVAEFITGSCCDLQDLVFERYVPENEATLVDTKEYVYILVAAQWGPSDGIGDDDEDESVITK